MMPLAAVPMPDAMILPPWVLRTKRTRLRSLSGRLSPSAIAAARSASTDFASASALSGTLRKAPTERIFAGMLSLSKVSGTLVKAMLASFRTASASGGPLPSTATIALGLTAMMPSGASARI
ncbi:hypothetical protein D3C72_1764220 [compost metagenome]